MTHAHALLTPTHPPALSSQWVGQLGRAIVLASRSYTAPVAVDDDDDDDDDTPQAGGGAAFKSR